MKYILLSLISFSSLAQPYYLKVSDFEACKNGEVVSLWSPRNLCQGECIEWEGSHSCDTVNLQDVLTDDLEKPIRDKTNVTTCEGQEACQLALESLECEEKYIDEAYSEVYCSKITGYEQKYSHKIAVVDQVKLDAKLAQEQAQAEEKALEAQIEKRMECGKKTIIEASKMNALKGYTNAQVMAFSAQFADIANLLKLGATDSANELIQATEPNELINQLELDQLSSFLTTCVRE